MDAEEEYGKSKRGDVKLKLEREPSNADQSLVLNATTSEMHNSSILSVKYYKVIVLDCTQVQFIDETTVKTLKEVINEYKKEKVKFFMTNCNGNLSLSDSV